MMQKQKKVQLDSHFGNDKSWKHNQNKRTDFAESRVKKEKGDSQRIVLGVWSGERNLDA